MSEFHHLFAFLVPLSLPSVHIQRVYFVSGIKTALPPYLGQTQTSHLLCLFLSYDANNLGNLGAEELFEMSVHAYFIPTEFAS